MREEHNLLGRGGQQDGDDAGLKQRQEGFQEDLVGFFAFLVLGSGQTRVGLVFVYYPDCFQTRVGQQLTEFFFLCLSYFGLFSMDSINLLFFYL